ncbi:MAG: hypothetical protein KKC21_03145 [Nitrospinae bacterium]|nr:hypothetical protein [Nitrospinota bacterium]
MPSFIFSGRRSYLLPPLLVVLILVLGGLGFYSLAADASDGITTKDKMDLKLLLKKYNGQSLYEDKPGVSPSVLDYKAKLGRSNGIIHVYATSFGNPGNDGESRHFKDGTRVRRGIVAVALPDESAIGKWVYVRKAPKEGKKSRWVKMKVRDLGPWFRDDPYWVKLGKEPRAVRYFKRKWRRFDGRVVVNPAGIDITPSGWQRLGVPVADSYNHSDYVEWRFAG